MIYVDGALDDSPTSPELTMQTLSPVPELGRSGPTLRALSFRSSEAGAPQSMLPQAAWAGGLLGILLVALYLRIGIKLVSDWITIPDYSHGILIPFFVAFLIWDQRERLLSTPLKPSWAGVPAIALGLLVLFTGVFGADLFLSRFSFLLLAVGMTWTLLGSPMVSRTKFILFVLFLAIPFPTLILNRITFPLQLFASEMSSWVLPLLGVPVLRDGNVIQLPAMPLEVAEACSGIRSLMSLFTVAVIFGYFVEKSTWRRTLLAVASLPIAVAANVARIVGTGLCVQYWDPVKALGFFHEFSGWLMFLVSMSCLYFVHTLMSRVAPRGVKA
jgi:exosortase